MNKAVFYLWGWIFFIPLISATEVVDFDFLIDQNDTVVLAQIRAYRGEPDFFLPEHSQYTLKVKTADETALWDIPLAVNFVVLDPLVNVSPTPAMVTLPYVSDYKELEVYRGDRKIFTAKLDFLCNNDTQCSAGENQVSCPGDCPVGSRDGFCGVMDVMDNQQCDSDCLQKYRNCRNVTVPFIFFTLLAVGISILLWRLYKNKKNQRKSTTTSL